MELIEFLDKAEVEIIRLVENAGYRIEENTHLCSISENYVGFLNKIEKEIIICTSNAKKREGYTLLRKKNKDIFDRTALHIKKALRHEAVHVAQLFLYVRLSFHKYPYFFFFEAYSLLSFLRYLYI